MIAVVGVAAMPSDADLHAACLPRNGGMGTAPTSGSSVALCALALFIQSTEVSFLLDPCSIKGLIMRSMPSCTCTLDKHLANYFSAHAAALGRAFGAE